MERLIFRPEDFIRVFPLSTRRLDIFEPGAYHQIMADIANARFEEWLSEQAEIYRADLGITVVHFDKEIQTWVNFPKPEKGYRARLVAIEEIKNDPPRT